jgi:prophage regulatory protein
MGTTILRLPAVREQLGRSRSSIYLDIQSGVFTKPVALGPRSVGWPDFEVDSICKARIAGKSEDDIRALVIYLEAARLELGGSE